MSAAVGRLGAWKKGGRETNHAGAGGEKGRRLELGF